MKALILPKPGFGKVVNLGESKTPTKRIPAN
jgi:hypothetical protein